MINIEKSMANHAYTRSVVIKPDGHGNYQSDAWSIHNTTKERFHRGCAIHPGLDEHKSRANNWVNRKEQYFF